MNEEDIEAGLLADEIFGHASRPAAVGVAEMEARILSLRAQIDRADGSTMYPPAQARLLQRLHRELRTARERLADYHHQLTALN